MKYIHLETIDSTNDYAKAHPELFDAEAITCIVAEEQTKGRGRFNRHWVSPKGANIYATYYFTLPIDTLHLASLSQISALSLVKELKKHGVQAEIKWPNDVRVGAKKLAGILAETRFHKETIEIFLGVGINVNLDQKTAEGIDQPATSLLIVSQKKWDKEALLKGFSEQLEKDLRIFQDAGFAPFKREFEECLSLKNEVIRCFDGKKVWEGTLDSITDDGQLNLRLKSGKVHTIISGDIINQGS